MFSRLTPTPPDLAMDTHTKASPYLGSVKHIASCLACSARRCRCKSFCPMFYHSRASADGLCSAASHQRCRALHARPLYDRSARLHTFRDKLRLHDSRSEPYSGCTRLPRRPCSHRNGVTIRTNDCVEWMESRIFGHKGIAIRGVEQGYFQG